MSHETILTNARPGAARRDAPGNHRDAWFDDRRHPGRAATRSPSAIDMRGDTVIPGVVDVHTDNLERQVQPRSLARWPSRSAMVAHDAQCAAAGVTTVLDALCLGDLGFDKERIKTFQDGVVDLDALTRCRAAEGGPLPAPALRNSGAGYAGAVRSGGGSSPGADDQPDGPQSGRWPVRQHGFLPEAAAAGRPR